MPKFKRGSYKRQLEITLKSGAIVVIDTTTDASVLAFTDSVTIDAPLPRDWERSCLFIRGECIDAVVLVRTPMEDTDGATD